MRLEFLELAERRVRLALLLAEVGRARDIEVTQEELQSALIGEARRHPGQEARVVQHYQEHPGDLQRLSAPILEEHVVDSILEDVSLTERSVTLADFVDFDPDPDDEEAGSFSPEERIASTAAIRVMHTRRPA